MDLKHLLKRISQSDEAAFRELFEHLFPGLLSFCMSILNDRHLAEEVVEDVFIKLWENRFSAEKIENPSLYLYKAVRYSSINAIAKRKKYHSVSLDEIGETYAFSNSLSRSDTDMISKENCHNIYEAVCQLPPKCRLIFCLIKEGGMKYKEVSKLLNLSEKTVENQMNIAFRKLIESFNATIPELVRSY